MRILPLCLLTAIAVLGVSTAQAESTLQGLEMDVMNANETPSQAAARIALPRPGNSGAYGPDYGESLAGQVRVGGGLTAESAGNGPVVGITVGEPVPVGGDEVVDDVPPDADPGADDGGVVDPTEVPIDPPE